MTARVRYTADALYPEYKTARLETFGEDMTNQKRRIEDKLPTEPLDWTEAQAEQTVPAGAARQGGITSEENGVGDLTNERIKGIGLKAGVDIFEVEEFRASQCSGLTAPEQEAYRSQIDFARAIERAAITAHLARQAQADLVDIEAIRQIADELELEASSYDGDFADTVNGCADALRHLIDNRTPAAPASAQNAEAIRNQALEEAAIACEAWGNEKVAKWSQIAGDDENSRPLVDDAKARAWDALQCASAIRALQSGTATTKEGGK